MGLGWVSAYSALAVKRLPGLREEWGRAAMEDGAHTRAALSGCGVGQECRSGPREDEGQLWMGWENGVKD